MPFRYIQAHFALGMRASSLELHHAFYIPPVWAVIEWLGTNCILYGSIRKYASRPPVWALCSIPRIPPRTRYDICQAELSSIRQDISVQVWYRGAFKTPFRPMAHQSLLSEWIDQTIHNSPAGSAAVRIQAWRSLDVLFNVCVSWPVYLPCLTYKKGCLKMMAGTRVNL